MIYSLQRNAKNLGVLQHPKHPLVYGLELDAPCSKLGNAAL